MKNTSYFTQLILNPAENLPYLFNVDIPNGIEGLYISDKKKSDEIIQASIIGFAGRDAYNKTILDIYSIWAKKLNANNISMRLLSGLHAHIILFMGIGSIGDTIFLLPEIAGGHFATKRILTRLGYNVIEMIADFKNMCVNILETRKLIKKHKPKFIFIDRSEGINYEDFSDLLRNIPECCAIFDASQYLTNIITKDYPSPFDMGFHLILSSLHKNFPGPQKALICSKENDIYWQLALQSLSNYVSNVHPSNIFLAGSIITHEKLLTMYSSSMLYNSLALEDVLYNNGLPIVKKSKTILPTHHIWLKFGSKELAFKFYKKMEQCNILVNYRLLPYQLGYGIRMGTAAASLQGLNKTNLNSLAEIITQLYECDNVSAILEKKSSEFISSLIPLTKSFTN